MTVPCQRLLPTEQFEHMTTADLEKLAHVLFEKLNQVRNELERRYDIFPIPPND